MFRYKMIEENQSKERNKNVQKYAPQMYTYGYVYFTILR